MQQNAGGSRRAFVLAAILGLLVVLSLTVKPTLTTTHDAPDERLNATDVQSHRSLMTILSCRRPPQVPSVPLLKSTYAASFPGSGDKIITQNLVEGMTGMFIGESNLSPSLAMASQTNRQQVRGLVSQAYQQVTGSSPQSSQRVPLATEPVANEQSPDSSDSTRRVLQAQDPAKFALDTKLRQQEASEERLQENTEISDSSRPQGEVILVRSQFPHTSGKLASWDDDIPRAIVILRNPLHALPCYFDRLYEMKSGLPTGTLHDPLQAKATLNAWAKWRSNQFTSQIILYRRFVSFWMEKYEGRDGNRIFFSYEDFLDEYKGQTDAGRLGNFLKEGVRQSGLHSVVIQQVLNSFVRDREVGCVYKETVGVARKQIQKRQASLQGRRTLQEAPPPNSSSNTVDPATKSVTGNAIQSMCEWNSEHRPLTPENLVALGQMLLELMNRWKSHQRVLTILSAYHREVNRVYLDSIGQLDNGASKATNQSDTSAARVKSFHIIQASPPHTASIAVINWLMGLFHPNEDIAFLASWPDQPVKQSGKDIELGATLVTKTSNLNILEMYQTIRPHFDEVFFVISNRGGDSRTRVDASLCGFKNVLCLEYEELQFDDNSELPKLVSNLTAKLARRFEFFFGAKPEWSALDHQSAAVKRLEDTSALVVEMQNQSVDSVDLKYAVHGRVKGGSARLRRRLLKLKEPNSTDYATGHGRRRLSVALPNGDCEITAALPARGVEKSYAASYPGCGARMTWSLIEALTGMWTGDDWDSNGRGRRVISVKTHYPHKAGKLVRRQTFEDFVSYKTRLNLTAILPTSKSELDDEIKRAIIIIRNPMNAIPSFFNHIFEIQNDLAIHSQRAPVADWIEWRDRLAMQQIEDFGKFIDYWMGRFDSTDDRLLVTYEALTDGITGPDEAARIANFLSKSEGVDDPIASEAIPCVWRKVVKYKDEVPASSEQQNESRRRLGAGILGQEAENLKTPIRTQRSGPTERPYTPDMLKSMDEMLSRLISDWGAVHVPLKLALQGYQSLVQQAHQAVLQAHQAASNIETAIDMAKAPDAPRYHIVQSSQPHSGSAVLNNLLSGLLDDDAEYKKSTLVTITPRLDLLDMYKEFKPNVGDGGEVFFVVSSRGTDPATRVAPASCDFNNVLCIEYEELMYANSDELQKMVNNFADNFMSRFGYFFGPSLFSERNRVDAVKRIQALDSAVASLKRESKNGPAITTDKSFHIFQVCPERPAAPVLANMLQGIFEPDQYLVNFDGKVASRVDGTEVPIESTFVTQTDVLELMSIYKQFRAQFDNVLFVVGFDEGETRIDLSLCEYDNVICFGSHEYQYNSEAELEDKAKHILQKVFGRFEYVFGSTVDISGALANAVKRVRQMDEAATRLASQSSLATDSKFGVQRSSSDKKGTARSPSANSLERKRFYCGGPVDVTTGRANSYSTFGLFLTNNLFPEFEGKIELSAEGKVSNAAIPLTTSSLSLAGEHDLLIMQSHQDCEVSLANFPGLQLHINAEHYDLHPNHLLNTGGELTYNYLPPGARTLTLGPHEDSQKSIRVPFFSMRLYYTHVTRPHEGVLGKIFDTSQKPKNTGQNFIVYVNSYYVEYRERAARALSEIGPVHTGGRCQGNHEAVPPPPVDDSAPQCTPFDDSLRPASIVPIQDQVELTKRRQKIELFSTYRYVLVMENADVPGYVSDQMLSAYLSGAVPIYFGSRFVFELFNPRSFIFFDLDIPQQALNQIQFYEQNPSEYERMLNEPILANGLETIRKYFSWDESIGDGLLRTRIRNIMGL